MRKTQNSREKLKTQEKNSNFRHFLESLNYIKQNRLKDTFHWTPLFSKEKFHIHEYDIPLDRVGHC